MMLTLKAARVNSGYSQKKMGELIGVSPSTICRWERGILLIPDAAFEKYCDLCDVDEEEVVQFS